MNGHSKMCVALFVFVPCLVAVPSMTSAQSLDSLFRQAMEEYRQLPSKAAVEKVIRSATAMERQPQVPDEARKHYVRGISLHKGAKSVEDLTQARDEFLQAVRLAPWFADARFNLALECEAIGDYPSALVNLKLYQLFKIQDASEARVAQEKIDAIEAKQEIAAQEEIQKQRIEKLKAHQQDPQKTLIRELKSFYDKKTYTISQCSHVGMNDCFREGQGFPCGCNEAEVNQDKWYGNSEDAYYILFPSDTTVVFGRTGYDPFLRGTARGRWVMSIFWEMLNGSDWAPVWVLLPEDNLTRVLYSPSTRSASQRPVDKSRYNPYQRYDYSLLKQKQEENRGVK